MELWHSPQSLNVGHSRYLDQGLGAVTLSIFSFLTVMISKVSVLLSLGSGQSSLEKGGSFLSCSSSWCRAELGTLRKAECSDRQARPRAKTATSLDRRLPTPSGKVTPV